jgi:hypothetical protein
MAAHGEGPPVVSRRLALIAGVVVVVLAVLAAVLLGVFAGGSRNATPPQRGFGATADLVPRAALFGDSVEAVVDVVLDRRAVKPESVELNGDFSPYAAPDPPSVVRRDAGPLTRLRYRLTLRCLDLACLPPDPSLDGRRMFHLAPIEISYVSADGPRITNSVPLPGLEVSSRLTPAEVAKLTPIDQPPFHASIAVPPPSYAISPTLLRWLLTAGGALLLAAAGLLLVFALRRRRPEPAPAPEPQLPVRVLSPLERALLLLERARERGVVVDRRKALERLAAELRRSGEPRLADTATELAWAEQPPPHDETRALEEAVRRRIAEGVNGREPVEV